MQRLILDEGQFVATYKFALLIALIDIAIEHGDDSPEWLAEKFIELYWNHSKPFGGAVLSQNTGANIAVLGRILPWSVATDTSVVPTGIVAATPTPVAVPEPSSAIPMPLPA